MFYWMPIEELIRSRQQEYYDALSKSDNEADSSYFVELMLEIILDTLKETTMVGKEENSNAPIRQIDGVLDGVLEKEILTLLKEEPTTTQMNLSKKLRIPYRTLQRKMKELQKAGKIERIGGKRYGYWK
ncbi:MAG: winged helix-turn-helix domain-containing protein [Sharpea porci]|uniref:winged helix-turn-helix domain-containing protein n=1 Tax=Sharpea porci TaxID=2652286 RepID=UPI002409F997|nr:winged helix-turn-helix domain-containing protein [Sharpea porci]MDD6711526.1 winged helix-turn-helix domain-containing protein [Sharpea porci]